MLFVNKIMIDNVFRIITIAQNDQGAFYDEFIKYYESGDISDLKVWIYDHCIYGIDLNNN